MEIKELIDFRERLVQVSFKNLRDEEFIREMVALYVLLGDFFSMIRLPNRTGLGLIGNSKYRNTRRVFEERRQKGLV